MHWPLTWRQSRSSCASIFTAGMTFVAAPAFTYTCATVTFTPLGLWVRGCTDHSQGGKQLDRSETAVLLYVSQSRAHLPQAGWGAPESVVQMIGRPWVRVMRLWERSWQALLALSADMRCSCDVPGRPDMGDAGACYLSPCIAHLAAA